MRNILYIQCIVTVNSRMGTRGNKKEGKTLTKMDGWIRKSTTNHRMTVGYVDKLSSGRREATV
jgi:hypothetical protein